LIECIQRAAFPGEDILGGFGPFEGLRLLVVVRQIVIDRSLKVIDAAIAAAPDAPEVISAKKRSTRFNHEALVGVKRSLKRGCLSSHALTSGVLWMA